MQENKRKIMVCLSAAPSNADIIRIAAQMAKDAEAELTALYVETPQYKFTDEKSKDRLRDHTRLAENLGAQIEIVYGDEVPFQIAEFAKLLGVDTIVLGQSLASPKIFNRKPSLTASLEKRLPDVEFHIIPDNTGRNTNTRISEQTNTKQMTANIAISLGVLAVATGTGVFFDKLGIDGANIIMTYLLGVMLIALLTTHRGYSLVSSVVAVFAFNFFFVEPRASLKAYMAGYPITFLVMFLTAFITGTLTIRLKENARQSVQLAYRTKIISDTDQMLAKANGRDEIINVCINQCEKLLGRTVFWAEEADDNELTKIADWIKENNAPAGFGQEVFQESKIIGFPLSVQNRQYGILAIESERNHLGLSETNVLLSILSECALALENEKNTREKEATAIRIQKERLRSNMLRSISHDLRTPLTSISGNASNLLSSGDQFDSETLRTLYSDIYDDSVWLINLVENLLASTRMEEGSVKLKLKTEFADELIAEAVGHVRPASYGRSVTVSSTEELLAVKAEANLIVQVLVNLLNNAIKYSPSGAEIRVSARREGQYVRFFVSNEGSRIPEEEKTRIFDMFYVGDRNTSDGRRGIGLGLALCQSITEAHGGTITVNDIESGGTEFSFTLPAEEVNINDEQ